MEVDINLKVNCKKRCIKLQADDPEIGNFHMMLIWDKSKPEGFKQLYQQIADDLINLLSLHDNKIYFTPIKVCTYSTYGTVDDWLTDFINTIRSKYDWINKEKDLPNSTLFAHSSRREIKGSLLNFLKEPDGSSICLNVKINK